jgi:hypothetical protein
MTLRSWWQPKCPTFIDVPFDLMLDVIDIRLLDRTLGRVSTVV